MLFKDGLTHLRHCIPSSALATALVALAACGTLPAADNSPYVGAEACGSCHPQQLASTSASGHARSLHPAADHPLAASFPSEEWLVRATEYRLRFRRAGEQIRAEGFDDNNTMDIPVDWAFGAGDQAVTFVTRVDADWYLEHYQSYYAALGTMAPTAGHQQLRPQSLPEAMGLPYRTLDPQTGILGCFECHSTGPVAIGPEQRLQPAERGVRCEACHGPGQQHVTAAKNSEPAEARQTIQNPARFPATQVNEFCGRCHRPPASDGVTIDWNYSWNVRHQPVYLSQSKCFTESEGRLSCFTCHEPHEPLRRDAASYNERCANCHDGAAAKPPEQPCLVNPSSNCIDCHMPRVTPQPPLRFTNHWIGVYRDGAKLKPL